jgi:ribose 5-phosphate isomerase B
MKIAIGADNLGYNLKEELKKYIESLGHEIVDCGCPSPDPVDYPDVAKVTVSAILEGDCERGILICGTGIGMAMAANKVKGIRAAQCHDAYSAERAAKSNNAHIITFGALIVGPELAKSLVKTWLESFFTGGPSARKIEKIMNLEKAV